MSANIGRWEGAVSNILWFSIRPSDKARLRGSIGYFRDIYSSFMHCDILNKIGNLDKALFVDTPPLSGILVQNIAQESAMRVVNFSDARNSLKTVIDQVIDDADYTVIARRDAPDAVVMSLDTFNSLMETVHLLKTPANAAHLAKSIGQLRSGKVVRMALLDA